MTENTRTDTNTENTHEKVLANLDAFVMESKVLVERVMKMRIQSKEAQIELLQVFHPLCLKIREVSNELSHRNVEPKNKNKIIGNREVNTKKTYRVYFTKIDKHN